MDFDPLALCHGALGFLATVLLAWTTLVFAAVAWTDPPPSSARGAPPTRSTRRLRRSRQGRSILVRKHSSVAHHQG